LLKEILMKDFVKGILVVLPILAGFSGSVVHADSILYATDAMTQQLYTLSRTDASPTLIGSFGVPGAMAGLAYDAGNDILYGSNTVTSSLYSINRSTGSATLIGPFGVGLMHGLAFDNLFP
jgi:hypothetical protein